MGTLRHICPSSSNLDRLDADIFKPFEGSLLQPVSFEAVPSLSLGGIASQYIFEAAEGTLPI
jgi:hypothetical protein